MEDRQATRERLIAVTHELVRRKGFDRTSVADVMAAAGVGKGSFYYHFSDKDSLGLAVLEQDRVGFMAVVDECLDAPTPLSGLERFFAMALEKHRATGFVGGCLWGNTALEMSDSNPVFASLVAELFDEWTAKIEATIRAGQEHGQIRSDLPAPELARSVVAIIEGGTMLSRLKKQEAPLRGCLTTLRTMLVEIPGAAESQV